ncbi:3-oxoadipate enol-lactonase [Limnohabitans sp. 2KL-3]|uniref:3-oxoadipate enol-lactonase n=1 Tax=Limnohabitans sp. 2KL-3 TaxID=1100700 RepID=UPI000AB80EE8|nr:3-oxoadipate enol-lactonase [Limnohabitans sp. 2KL-3]
MEISDLTMSNSQTVMSLNTARGLFRVAIDGDLDAPPLVLSNSLGTTMEMWSPQVEAFSKNYRVIRYDTRGHGGSLVTNGPYTIEGLGTDVLAILDALQIAKTAFCGISLGGHTGLWLGVNASDRLESLAVCNSAACIGTFQAWQERAAAVRQGGSLGMKALADSAPSRWFTPSFVSAQQATVQAVQAVLEGISPEGYASCCEALALSDLRADLKHIKVRTLLVAGAHDPVTTEADADAMQVSITGARTMVLKTSHLSNLEAPQVFNRTILDFISDSFGTKK